MGGQFLVLREAYIFDMSLLLSLEPFQKFGVAVWWINSLVILKLSHPSIAGVKAGAELGN